MSNYVHNRCPHAPADNRRNHPLAKLKVYIYHTYIQRHYKKKNNRSKMFSGWGGQSKPLSSHSYSYKRLACKKNYHPKIILIKRWSCTWPVAADIIWPVAADIPWPVASSVEVGGGRWELGDGHCLLRQIRLICMQARGRYLAKWIISTIFFKSRRTERHCSNLRLPASTQILA